MVLAVVVGSQIKFITPTVQNTSHNLLLTTNNKHQFELNVYM